MGSGSENYGLQSKRYPRIRFQMIRLPWIQRSRMRCVRIWNLVVRDVSTMTSGVSGFQGTVSKDTVPLDTAF